MTVLQWMLVCARVDKHVNLLIHALLFHLTFFALLTLINARIRRGQT
jgi:hypothetical protein